MNFIMMMLLFMFLMIAWFAKFGVFMMLGMGVFFNLSYLIKTKLLPS